MNEERKAKSHAMMCRRLSLTKEFMRFSYSLPLRSDCIFFNKRRSGTGSLTPMRKRTVITVSYVRPKFRFRHEFPAHFPCNLARPFRCNPLRDKDDFRFSRLRHFCSSLTLATRFTDT